MPNYTNMAISAKEAINDQKQKITCIVGGIKQEGIDNSEEEIAGILVGVNSDHFEERHTNGHLVVIIPVEQYCTIIGANMCMYNPNRDTDAYNPTAANAPAAL